MQILVEIIFFQKEQFEPVFMGVNFLFFREVHVPNLDNFEAQFPMWKILVAYMYNFPLHRI